MRPSQAPSLFNGAVHDVLDLAEAMPAYALAKGILAMDKEISEFERAVATMRDCYNTLKNAKDFSFERPVIVL